MNSIKDDLNVNKERHGCVTTWLVLMIILNSIAALVNFLATDSIVNNLSGKVSTVMIIILGVLGIANVVFSIMILQWKKLGFWGFILSSIIALAINLKIGLEVKQSFIGLIGIVILYGILHIKKDNVSTWEYLE